MDDQQCGFIGVIVGIIGGIILPFMIAKFILLFMFCKKNIIDYCMDNNFKFKNKFIIYKCTGKYMDHPSSIECTPQKLLIEIQDLNYEFLQGNYLVIKRAHLFPPGKVACEIRKGFKLIKCVLIDMRKYQGINEIVDLLPKKFFELLLLHNKQNTSAINITIFPTRIRVTLLNPKKGFEKDNIDDSFELMNTLLHSSIFPPNI